MSAAIIRGDRVLVVRRARPPGNDVFTLPGGVVEAGETLRQAVVREVIEETGLSIEPVALAGHREMIRRDAEGRVERHFIIFAFVARWQGGEPRLNHELAEARWVNLHEVTGLRTTEGLADIIATAFERLKAAG